MALNRRKIVLVSALSAIGLAVIIAGFYLIGEAKHIALRKITAAVDEALDEPYRFELEDFKVRLLDGMIAIPGARIVPDSAALTQMATRPRTLCTIASGRIEVHIRRERRGVLEIRSIRIVDPQIDIRVDSTLPRPADHQRKPFRLPFSAVRIGSLSISGGHFHYDSLAIDGLELQADNLLIDTAIRRLQELPPLDDLRLKAARITHRGNAYAFDFHGIALGVREQVASLDSLAVTPHYEKSAFAAQVLRDWMQLRTKALSISGLDFREAIARRALRADSIAVAGLEIASYKNRRVWQPARVKPLFHQSLQRIPIPLEISKIEITDSRAVYEELPVAGNQPGIIHFEKIAARVDSLSNIVGEQDYYTLTASARVMGAGRAEIVAQFPIDSLSDHFAMHGTLGRMELTALNPVIRPLGHLGVHAGELHRLWFNLEGDSHNSLIAMRMEYDSLHVEILNKEGLTSLVGSALANALIVRDANPMPGGEVREVEATAVRDPYRSHFNYLWRTLFAGIKPSIGLGEGEQEAITTLQHKLQQLKEQHRQRKAARKLKNRG